MEKLKRSLSFRKKKDHVPECSKPHQWQEDERKVREGTCSFQVRYLGCIEVFESRGMQVCEEAVKALKARQNRSVWSRMSLRKKKKDKDKKRKKGKEDAEEVGEEPMDLEQCKGKYQRAILYVSGDALRVVDEISKGLIVDQTIEKVSFCAPDRNHEKGFAYICRDGTTRRWMCHGFLALKESGERLSHAVGCAFAICLEKKQKREKDAVVVQYNEKGTSFTRTGSFRQATLTERLADPQSTILAAPVPQSAQENPFAVSRPHASQAMLYRQGSFRGFQKLNESSPFKRQLSLRLNELPSTLQRQQDVNQNGIQNGAPSSSPIPEASPTKENADTISEMCQQLTQGLSALATSEESYNSPPRSAPPTQTSAPMHQFGARQGSPARQPPQSAHSQPHPTQAAVYTVTAQGRSIPLPEPIRQNNPWAGVSPTPSNVSSSASTSGVSDADAWLNTTASSISQQPAPQDPYAQGIMNGVPQPAVHSAVPQHLVHHQPLVHQQPVLIQADPFGTGAPYGMIASPPSGAAVIHHRAPHLTHLRSHSIDTADMWANQHQRAPTLRELSHVPQAHFQSQQQNGNAAWHSVGSPPPSAPPTTNIRRQPDPFEAAWAAKSTNKPNTNPFQSGDSNVTKAFEVKL